MRVSTFSRLDLSTLIWISRRDLDFSTRSNTHTHLNRYAVAATIAADEVQRNFLSILVLVTRLKQACLDPSLLPEDITDVMNNLKNHVRKRKKKGKPLSATEIQALFNCLNGIAKKATEEVYECVICYEPQDTKDIRVIRNCKHSFCVSCLEKYIRMEQAKGNMQAMYVVALTFFECVRVCSPPQ